jgi:hypothetical protein
VLHCAFDNPYETRVTDASGRGNDRIFHGARRARSGHHGGACWFDGIDDYVETASSDSLRVQRALTISLCVFRKPDEAANTGMSEHLLAKGNVAVTDYSLYVATTHAFRAAIRHVGQREPQRIAADPSTLKVDVSRWFTSCWSMTGALYEPM